jgi:peptidyl-prolyl cis-trans isomerase B (cyclophilin B)
VPTNKQRREAARRHLERQLQRRQEREAARRRFNLIASIVGTLVVIAGIVVAVVFLGDGKKTPAAAASDTAGSSPTPTPTSTFVGQKTSGPCGYATADASANPDLKDVGMPPDPDPTPTATVDVEFTTNRGTIDATLDGKNAPCTVQALSYLIQQGFYDNTPCPRVVNSGIFVVQCGSGGDTTAGGPTFTIPDENLDKADYSAGAIAMANTGAPDSGSSQFFFITKDSSAGLTKSYTVVGQVTKGLDILQQVAEGGDDGSSGSVGGGKPKLDLTFQSVKIVAVHGATATPGAGPTPTLVPTATAGTSPTGTGAPTSPPATSPATAGSGSSAG